MNREEFSLLFHRAQVNLVAFKKLYEPEAFEAMQRMVEMAVAEEREACAKVCEERIGGAVQTNDWWFGFRSAMKQCATAIRARGQA